ncbi:MAG: ABC transporter ATP-binding protein [Acidimicrobiia bacterium]|nr:ABC transporter ATP-binding protein [Acidimicrobiia bacterium]
MGPHRLLPGDASAVEGARLERRTLRRVWELARPYRTQLLGFLTTIVVAALLGLVPPLLIRTIVDEAIPARDRGLVVTIAMVMVGVAFASALLSLAERWWSTRIGEGLIYDLRVKLFDHVQRMPVAFFTRTQTGSLISRLNNDVIGAQSAVTGTLGSVLSNAITLGTTLVAMVVLEWRLTVLGLVIVPLFLVPSRHVGKRLQKLAREGMDLNASMNTTMTERFGVSGAMLVKLFGRYEEEVDGFAGRAVRVRDIGIRQAIISRTFFVAMATLASVGSAVIYLVGGLLVIDNTITLGTLIALGTYVTRLYAPIQGLTNTRVDVMTAFVSFDRVFEVLDTPAAIVDRPGAVDLVERTGRIELDGVRFRYPAATDVSIASLEGGGPLSTEPGVEVLRGIDAVVEPGQLVALVGPSGAGKTTLASLVPRLYDVTAGGVRIDGHDVRDLTGSSLRAAIGVVSQDPHLFHDTVGANLRYARPDATPAEIEAACRAARIHDVIAALPDGYDTLVGERGYRLSGGEKQRVAIARMLLKDPRVVVLDEATSHLDSENEHLVQQALAEALQGRTSIVIAHRLSTIVDADQILVLDDGRVVERGRHDELLALDGLYAELYRTLVRASPAPAPAPAPT